MADESEGGINWWRTVGTVGAIAGGAAAGFGGGYLRESPPIVRGDPDLARRLTEVEAWRAQHTENANERAVSVQRQLDALNTIATTNSSRIDRLFEAIRNGNRQ